jgi:hypothetical protein
MANQVKKEILSLYELSIMCFKHFEMYTSDFSRDKRVMWCMVWFIITLFFSPCFPFCFTLSHISSGLFGFVSTYQLYYIYGEKISILKYCGWHIHHWFYCMNILVILLLVLNTVPPIIIGFCFGGIVHGIQFSEWYNFEENNLIKKPFSNKINECPPLPQLPPLISESDLIIPRFSSISPIPPIPPVHQDEDLILFNRY